MLGPTAWGAAEAGAGAFAGQQHSTGYMQTCSQARRSVRTAARTPKTTHKQSKGAAVSIQALTGGNQGPNSFSQPRMQQEAGTENQPAFRSQLRGTCMCDPAQAETS